MSLGSLQYTLSMDEMALIHENARQYMQEHGGSPSQPGVLAAHADSPSQLEAVDPAAVPEQAGELADPLHKLESNSFCPHRQGGTMASEWNS